MRSVRKRLLIVRPDSIGDFIIFSAVLEEYVKMYPEHKIDLLCQPKVKELVKPIPFVTRVICINSTKIFRKKHVPYMLFSIIRLLLLKYDTVIYPVFSRAKSGDTIVRFIRAKEKIAFDGNSSNDPANERVKRNRYYTTIIESEKCETTEIERNAEFINKLGADVNIAALKPKIWFLSTDDIEFQQLQRSYNFSENSYIAIFPGAGHPVRYLETEKWAELIRRILSENPKYKIVILGHGNDSFPIKSILEALGVCCRKRIVNLYEQTTLRLLAKVIQNAKLFIGTESGAVHVAAAVGTPNICLMGGGHFGRFYPYGDLSKNKIVYYKMDCFGCNWQCKYRMPKCIREIRVEDIWKEAASFLS